MDANPKPKIVVVGAGAVGSLIGGLLARGGEDVTLIARQSHVEAIHEKGLHIEGVLGKLIIPVKAFETLDFKPDLVLLAVKSQDVETSCRENKDYLQNIPVITLQNGVRSDNIVATLLPKENIISGVVMFNSQFLKPGLITLPRVLVRWLLVKLSEGMANGSKKSRLVSILPFKQY